MKESGRHFHIFTAKFDVGCGKIIREVFTVSHLRLNKASNKEEVNGLYF